MLCLDYLQGAHFSVNLFSLSNRNAFKEINLQIPLLLDEWVCSLHLRCSVVGISAAGLRRNLWIACQKFSYNILRKFT